MTIYQERLLSRRSAIFIIIIIIIVTNNNTVSQLTFSQKAKPKQTFWRVNRVVFFQLLVIFSSYVLCLHVFKDFIVLHCVIVLCV